MSASVLISNNCLFPENPKDPFKYLFPTLLFQNYEFVFLQKKESFFPQYISSIIEAKNVLEEIENEEIKESQQKISEQLNSFFARLEKQGDIESFYETLQKCSKNKIFVSFMESAIQRILLKLFSDLKEEEDNAVLSNSHFLDAFDNVKKNQINDHPVLVLLFLRLLKKNLRLYCDPKTKLDSRDYVPDKKYDFLYLYLDDQFQLRFMLLERKIELDPFYVDKHKIPEKEGNLLPNLEKLAKEEESSGDEQNNKNDEKSEDEEKEEEIDKNREIDENRAFDKFIDFILRILNNVPEKFKENDLKSKVSERIYTEINEKEPTMSKNMFEEWKKKCLKVKKNVGKAELKSKQDIADFQKVLKKKYKNLN